MENKEIANFIRLLDDDFRERISNIEFHCSHNEIGKEYILRVMGMYYSHIRELTNQFKKNLKDRREKQQEMLDNRIISHKESAQIENC